MIEPKMIFLGGGNISVGCVCMCVCLPVKCVRETDRGLLTTFSDSSRYEKFTFLSCLCFQVIPFWPTEGNKLTSLLRLITTRHVMSLSSLIFVVFGSTYKNWSLTWVRVISHLSIPWIGQTFLSVDISLPHDIDAESPVPGAELVGSKSGPPNRADGRMQHESSRNPDGVWGPSLWRRSAPRQQFPKGIFAFEW